MIKTKLLAVFFIFSNITIAQWVSSEKKVSTLYSVSYLNKDTLFANTTNGNLISYNGGASFDSLGVFTYQRTVGISYRSRDTIIAAYVGGKSGLLKTTDGAKTWQYQTLLTNTGDTAFKTKSISFMYFFNSNQGLLVGDTFNGQYQLFTTTNSGLTWQYEQHSELHKMNIRLRDVLVNQKGFDVYIHPAGVIKLKYSNKAILTISDYGKHWQLDSIKQPDWTFRSAAFKDSLNGIASIATATSLVMAKTTDGGKNWALLQDSLKENASASLRYVRGTDRFPAFYFAFGFKGAHVSYNDGESWQRLDTFRHDQVFFRDAETGISLAYRFVSEPILYFNPNYVGLNEQANVTDDTKLFHPNPASTNLQFTKEFQKVELVDVQGKKWMSESTPQHWDISGFPSGFYTVFATDHSGTVCTQKLIIAH